MRSKALAFLLALFLVPAVVPAYAQSAGTVELGGFGRYTAFDKDRQFKNKIGFGGRLGIFFARNLALEADGSYTTTTGPITAPNISYLPLHARLVYNIPAGSSSAFLLGVGYAHNEFKKDFPRKEDGPTGLVGLRIGLGPVLALRVDGTVDYMKYKTASVGNFTDFSVQAGLSLILGNHHRAKDSDHDGVLDSNDLCPGTAPGQRVDSTGCPIRTAAPTPPSPQVAVRDSDGDGIPDTADRCPNTPSGDKVDVFGCTIPQDSDNDGVLDNADRCPNTPAGEAVDANGCSASQRDTDRDGVTDDKDRCPTTAAGEKVDAFGCPVLFEPGKKAVILQGVNFETGKSILLPESQEVLDRVAASLLGNPDIRVEIAGYTDSKGSSALNLRLSNARSGAVKDYLVSKGVSENRLVAKGYGAGAPVASNLTADGRAQNRRVELHKLN